MAIKPKPLAPMTVIGRLWETDEVVSLMVITATIEAAEKAFIRALGKAHDLTAKAVEKRGYDIVSVMYGHHGDLRAKHSIITEECFENLYQPTQAAAGASFNGTLFETCGKDLEKVVAAREKAPCTVWTLVETDGNMSIISGFHFVNRLGYFITAAPVKQLQLVEVQLTNDAH